MEQNLKCNIILEKEENFEGKRESVLSFECKKCSEHMSNFYNHKCISCFFNAIYDNKDKRFKKIHVELQDLTLDLDLIKIILDYYKNLAKIKKNYEKIKSLKSCLWDNFNCKIFMDVESFIFIKNNVFYDPVLFYQEVSKKLKVIKEKEIKDAICVECVNSIYNYLKGIKSLLKKSLLVVEFKRFQKSTMPLLSIDNSVFYEYLFTKSRKLNKSEDSALKSQFFQGEMVKKKLIKLYKFGKYDLYQTYIYDIDNYEEFGYDVVNYYDNVSNVSNKDYFERFVNKVVKEMPILRYRNIILLEDLIKLYNDEALRIIELNFELNKEIKEKIAFISALKILKLEKLFPLLIDDYLEEIFLDSPDSEIYVNHQEFGRCRTTISLSNEEIERIKTLLRLYSGQRLDYSNPSLKYVLKNKYFFCRIAIDIEPVNINKFSLDIRKLNKNILTLQDLVKNNTLNPTMAAFLFFCILHRVNITATGETDTGKTTLINSFDFIAPDYLRKVYVENVIESLEQINYGKHQLKYQADSDSIESSEAKYTKTNYIKTLLHRSPDIIFLGEILTQEEAEAMFHCLAAGLRGFQTLHSNTIDSFINRIIHHFKINHSCLDDLDLIILLKKDFNKRRIVSITELDINNFHQADKYYRELFEYDPDKNIWIQHHDLYETKTIQKLTKFESLNREKFNTYLLFYVELFEFLSKIDKISNSSLVKLFRQISYYSRRSFSLLKNFWENWKSEHKNRTEIVVKPN